MPKHVQIVTSNRYKVIPRSLIFLFDQQNVLLIKGAKNKKIWANMFNGLGGHIERGENVIESAKRELLEETGILNQPLWICGNILIDTDDINIGILLFVLKGHYIGGELTNHDEGKLYWVNMNELPIDYLVEDLKDLLPIVFAHKITDPIFSAKYQYDELDNLVISFSDES